MSELRYNLISRELVIIATERAKRPEDFKKAKKEKIELPEYRADCPFCPKNEKLSPPETFSILNGNSWRTRVIPNKFSALSPDASRIRTNKSVYYRKIDGYGFHEVIIEHPKHNMIIALMSYQDVENIIKTYHARYTDIQNKEGIEAIVIFKNHGPSAGTSQEHPHSQLIATPVVPPQIRERVEQSTRFYDGTGQCMFCVSLDEELKDDKKRIVTETEHFVSLIPYATLSPFATRVTPKRHMPSFADINEAEIKDLAINLKDTLAKLYYGLDNPDFNYTIRSIPVHEYGRDYFHWYLSIIPRISRPAGFELGSGIFINSSLPEEGAAFLRQVKIP
ncbi:MAG: galactose-1-phosphate uridylyltransferase [Candidatus Omnitrophica bacterium]|jgi:UDPglucose--hexose-1-phosphate uridylyltransferase|nr:galactose-1-phosphate uridylyltransferase [Candidatus Omnitrophota bacterium]